MGVIKGEIYGYKVVQDDDVQELRLPKEIINVLKYMEVKNMADEETPTDAPAPAEEPKPAEGEDKPAEGEGSSDDSSSDEEKKE